MTFTFDTPMPVLLDNITNLEFILKFILILICNSYSCLENLLLTLYYAYATYLFNWL